MFELEDKNTTMLTETVENRFAIVDYGVFVSTLIVSIIIGLYFGCFGKKKQTTEEFLLGNRKMPTIPVAISLISSQISAIAIIAVPAEVYGYGVAHVFLQVPCVLLATIVTSYVVLPVFYRNKLTNCYSYLELRFDKNMKLLTTFIFILCYFALLPLYFYVPALAFSQISGLNVHIINVIICSICIFYTMAGGIRGVIWTDAIQAIVMIASTLVVVIMGTIKVGGLSTVLDRAIEGNRLNSFDMTIDLTTRQTFLNMMLLNFFMACSQISFNQSCVQRILSVPSIYHARRVLYVFCLGFMVLKTFICFTGIIMYAYFYACDPIKMNLVEKPDRMIPYFAQNVIGHMPGMLGIFISCVVSASLSTIAGILNSLSGIIYKDFIVPSKCIPHHFDNKHSSTIMKIIIFIIGIYSLLMGFVVEQFISIFQMVITFLGLTNGIVLGIFTFGMLYPWANKKAALWSTIISMIVVFWIVAGAQVLTANGELKYDRLPTRTDGCIINNNTFLTLNQNVSTIPLPIRQTEDRQTEEKDQSFSIYKTAFPWYTVFGAIIIWIVGIPLSHIIGNDKPVDIEFLSPIVHGLIRCSRSRSRQSKQQETKKDVELKNMQVRSKKNNNGRNGGKSSSENDMENGKFIAEEEEQEQEEENDDHGVLPDENRNLNIRNNKNIINNHSKYKE